MAAMFNIHCLVLAVALVICVHGVVSSVAPHVTAVEGPSCDGDLDKLVVDCASFIINKSDEKTPSKICCDVVKKIDIECACTHVTKEIEAAINLERAVEGFAICGRPLNHGFKCGSYTVPLL